MLVDVVTHVGEGPTLVQFVAAAGKKYGGVARVGLGDLPRCGRPAQPHVSGQLPVCRPNNMHGLPSQVSLQRGWVGTTAAVSIAASPSKAPTVQRAVGVWLCWGRR